MSNTHNNTTTTTPTLVLTFAGCTSDNSRGAAAVCHRDGSQEPLWSTSRKLGTSSQPQAAAYLGLISGLRRLLEDLPLVTPNVTIRGSSRDTLTEMMGEAECQSEVTQLYQYVAQGLVSRLNGEVTWELITQEENGDADYLAENCASLPLEAGEFLNYQPSQMNLTLCQWQGTKLVASHDAGTSSTEETPHILLDAGTLVDIMGPVALEHLQDNGMTSVLQCSNSHHTILGILSNLTFAFVTDRGMHEVTLDKAVVIDFLPTPIHISLTNPAVEEALPEEGWSMSSSDGLDYDKVNVPERFQQHPYWTNNSGNNPTFDANGHSLD